MNGGLSDVTVASNSSLLALAGLASLLLLALWGTTGPSGLPAAGALVRRRFTVYWSYRFAVGATVVHFIVLLLLIGVVATQLFPPLREFQLERGRDYATFLLVAIIAWPAVWEGYEITYANVRAEQTTGIFESLIPTPIGVAALPLAYLVITLPVSSAAALIAYLFFTHLLGVTFPFTDPLLLVELAAAIGTGILMTWGLGLFLGALATIVKEAGPAGNILKMTMFALSGIYVPLTIFPRWAQVLAEALPATHAMRAIRWLFAGDHILDHPRDFATFFGYTLLLVAAGLWTFRRSVDVARKQGSTAVY